MVEFAEAPSTSKVPPPAIRIGVACEVETTGTGSTAPMSLIHMVRFVTGALKV